MRGGRGRGSAVGSFFCDWQVEKEVEHTLPLVTVSMKIRASVEQKLTKYHG